MTIDILLEQKEKRLSQIAFIEEQLAEAEGNFELTKTLKAKKLQREKILEEIESDLQELGYRPEKEVKKVEKPAKKGKAKKEEVKKEEPKTVIVTQEMMDENPELAEQGVSVGDEVEVEEE